MLSDDEPAPARPRVQPPPLDRMGVDELHAYLAELRSEIARAEAEVARKREHLWAAEGVFGPSRT